MSFARKIYKPIIYRNWVGADRDKIKKLTVDGQVDEVVDDLEETWKDLFLIDFPFIDKTSAEFHKTYAKYKSEYLTDAIASTVSVYYPWRRTLVLLPSRDLFLRLRTARNRFLITDQEQAMFHDSLIGIAGLSVGSSVLYSIIMSGGPKRVRIADSDTLAVTNLNRLFASVCDLGYNKAVISARKIYEMNPFQEVELFTTGLTERNLDNFFSRNGKKLQLFIEETDTISMKIKSRIKARDLKIPVIMVSDNADNAIIDVERFDLEPKRPLFHGLVGEDEIKHFPNNPSASQKARIAVKIVGTKISPRLQYSLTVVEARIPTWPQLGTGASVAGAAACYVARRILTNASMPSGRYEVNLDSQLDTDYFSEDSIAFRQQEEYDFIQGFQLLYDRK